MTHVLLTGASSGIGEAMAIHFASLGWNITLAARREDMLRKLATQLESDSAGVKTFVRRVDLSAPDDCQALIQDAEAALGPIDILINNAGIQFVEEAAGVTPERIDLLLRVDLLSPLHLMHFVLPAMLERKSGTVVNVASMAGLIPTPGMMHYNAAKAGLAAASESLRVELKSSGVNVFTVYPGPVKSPMEDVARQKFEDSFGAKNAPMGDPTVLAKKIARGIQKKQARLIYPSFYKASRYTRVFSQWVTDTFAPKLISKD